MNRRTKTIVGAVVGVVALALVIFVGSLLSSPKKSAQPPSTIEVSQGQQSQDAYNQGLSALQSGDTTKAITELSQAVRLDPNNTTAKQKLAEVTAAQSAANSNSNPGSTSSTRPKPAPAPVKPADPFLAPVADLAVLLPKSYAGFAVGTPTTDTASAVLVASPTKGGPVSHVQWSVYDRKTANGASQFISGVSKSLYGKDASSVTVHSVSGHFGTDGTLLASVSFVRGRYVFEVVLTVPGGSPSDAKSAAVSAANAFATKL